MSGYLCCSALRCLSVSIVSTFPRSANSILYTPPITINPCSKTMSKSFPRPLAPSSNHSMPKTTPFTSRNKPYLRGTLVPFGERVPCNRAESPPQSANADVGGREEKKRNMFRIRRCNKYHPDIPVLTSLCHTRTLIHTC